MKKYDYSDLRNYWILKIDALLAYKKVDNANLIDPNWKTTLDSLINSRRINLLAIDVCKEIYGKATENATAFPDVDLEKIGLLIEDYPKDDAKKYWDIYSKNVRNWEVMVQYHFWLLDSLNYTPTNNDNNIKAPWGDIEKLLGNKSLEWNINFFNRLYYGLTDLLGKNQPLPSDWEQRIVKKSDLDLANINIRFLRIKSNEYDRINAKLGGRISDDLDKFLTPPPHTHSLLSSHRLWQY